MREEDLFAVKVHKFIDILLTGFVFVVAYYIKVYLLPAPLRGLLESLDYSFVLLLIIIVWYAGFQYFDFHSVYGKQRARQIVVRIARAITIQSGILTLLLYVFRIQDVSRALIGIFLVADFSALCLSMWVRVHAFKRRFLPSILLIVIGSKEAAKDLVDSIIQDSEVNCQVIGCLDIDPNEVGKSVHDSVKIIGTLDQLQDIVTNQVVDEVIFAMPIGMIWAAEQYLSIVENVGVKIRILPHWHVRKFLLSRPRFYSMHFEDFYGNPTFVLTATSQKRSALLLKSLFDYSTAVVVSILALPMTLVVACLIKLISPGPVFYKQERCGLYGRRFNVYKFRTMVPDADKMLQTLLGANEADGPVFKMKNDPRIIPYIGTFLRKFSLDELPQIINVLEGDMSIVGPRPPIPAEVSEYKLWERRRLSMKPGLTCLWQIAPKRNSLSFQEWMKLDLQYIDNWSLWLDLSIILRTFRAVLFGYGM